MQLGALEPFIPSGKDFALARQFLPWGLREVHLIDPAGVCWHFGQR